MHMQGEPLTMQRTPDYGDVAAEVRQDARTARALLVRERGRHADERLAAAGHGRAREKVELAARAADLAQAGAFGRDLTVEIGRDAAVVRCLARIGLHLKDQINRCAELDATLGVAQR